MSEETVEVLFNQLCVSNGLDTNGSANDYKKIIKLELFFSGYSRICGLTFFPNLTELIIIDQSIRKIENLENCVNLVSLWICECELTTIEGLDYCGQLRHLYLYDNKINKIKNIDSLRLLETVWLNDNEIQQIEGLDELLILDELNLSGNRIKSIGNQLKPNISLTNLLLSGNLLDNIDDLLNLSKLPKLKYLSINGPDYVSNPLASHPNYFLFILYHLPHIKSLDSFEITNHNCLKDIISNIISKKRLFYSMKIEILQRNSAFTKQKLAQISRNCLKFTHKQIEDRIKVRKMIEAVDKREQEVCDESLRQVEADLAILYRIIDKVKMEADFYEVHHIDRVNWETKNYYQLELASCGNFKFEISENENLVWFKLCWELLNARFCKLEALNTSFNGENYKITGLKAHKVTKLKNFLTEKRYCETVKLIQQDCGELTENIKDNTSEDYLFLSLNCLDTDENIIDVLKRIYSNNNGHDLFKLTNSLFGGDLNRNKKVDNNSNSSSCNNSDDNTGLRIKYGRVLLVKCFIKYTETTDNLPPLINGTNHKLRHKVYRIPFSDCTKYQCDCINHKFNWYFRGSQLLIPEYVVDFEYATDNRDIYSPLYCAFHNKEVDNFNFYQKQMEESGNWIDMTKKELNYEAFVAGKSHLLAKLNSSLPLDGDLKCLTSVNLTDCKLKQLNGISQLNSLEELIAPFNNLVSISEVNNSHLKVLDVSFNRLQNLETLEILFNLKTLLLNNNYLSKNRSDINILIANTSNLSELDLSNNLFYRESSLRVILIGRMKYLRLFNKIPVTDNEIELSTDIIMRSRISDHLLVRNSRTDTIKPRSLLLDNTAAIIDQISDNRLLVHTTNENEINNNNNNFKFSKITSLNLNHQNLYKITNLDMLDNLRYLSLIDNNISKIEGLQYCLHLEELILDRNLITKIDNLSRLVKLKRLSLNENYVVSLNNLRGLTSLECLSINTNRILSLSGLEQCYALVELYLANNFINENTEIYFLKSLSNLIVLDLFNNPIVEMNRNYRMSIIFHLKQLKALDGCCVEPTEVQQSKEMLGGRLNLDYIHEKIHDDNYERLVELDFSNCCLKSVELSPVEKLMNLKSLNLENNNLTTFSGLIVLRNLKVLCLNNNSIDSVLTRQNRSNTNNSTVQPISSTEPRSRVELKSLEVLHLGYNHIKSISQLGLAEIPTIKALFLQGNDLSSIDGLENLRDLREIVLDQNRIKSISETSFTNNERLQEIHLDDNRLKAAVGLFHLKLSLKRLYLGNNKITELKELDLFYQLESLIDISLHGNPVCRRNHHRYYLMHMLPSLLMIDGIEISDDEKFRLEATLEDHYSDSNVLPGILNSNRLMYSNRTNDIISNTTGNASNISNNSSNSMAACNIGGSYGSHINAKLDNTYSNRKQRSGSMNTVGLNKNSLQLIANSKAVYFYDPIGQVDSVPRLYFNKRK